MRIRAVVFDLFDTLVDLRMENIPPQQHRGRPVPATTRDIHALVERNAGVDYDRFATVLSEVDRDLWQSRLAQDKELPTEERFRAVLERLGLEDEALVAAMTEAHMSRLREQVVYIDHHPGVLAELRQSACIGLCSNFSHSPTALRVLDAAGLSEHLDEIVVSDRVGIRKPSPEIFRVVIDRLGVAPEEVLHVGDNIVADVQGAAELGIRTAWITRRVRDPESVLGDYQGPEPDWRIEDLAELPGLLASRAAGPR